MKISLFVLLTLYIAPLHGQDFIDIAKLQYTSKVLGNQANAYKTSINTFNFELTMPKVISEKKKLIFGVACENTDLRLNQFDVRRSLTGIRLNMGLKLQFSEKWAGTFVFLPKIASDFKQMSSNDFQCGVLTLFDHQLNDALKLKFGLYSSTKNFGATATPIFGFWHRSKNQKFYVNATLPMRIDVNYALAKKLNIGIEGSTAIKTYNIAMDSYAEEKSMNLAMYLSHGFLKQRLILRGKLGFDSTDYGVYASNDKTGFQVMAFPLSGDKRNRLNPQFLSNYYLGADIIFRLDLTGVKDRK